MHKVRGSAVGICGVIEKAEVLKRREFIKDVVEEKTPYGNEKKAGTLWNKKVIKLKFRSDRRMMDQRKCLSEYPFGTVKRWMDAGYYFLKGIQKTDEETALIFLGYNLVRALNLLGFKK